MAEPQVGRQIFNANLDITNITLKKDIDEILLKTFDYIAKTLEDHCGPYGGFAIINDPLHPVEEPIFTKDGINIVRNLQFASPMQEFVKKNLAYVGSRIESAGGDGTTSAMMIASVALREMIKKLKKAKGTYSYKDLVKAFDMLVEQLKLYYESNTYTIDDICKANPDVDRKDVIAFVARNQGYTSAHGDMEVAEAMVKIFTTTPESAWDYMFLMRERFETEQRLNVVIDETQYTVDRCKLSRNDQMTEDMGTKYIRKDIPIIVSSFALCIDDYSAGEIVTKIEKAIVDGEPLAVLAPDMTDDATQMKLDELMIKHQNHKVAIFYLDAHDPKVNDLTILRLLIGDDLTQPYCETKCDLFFDGAKLELNKLYENPEDLVEHPYSKDKVKYPQYNEILEYIDKVIEEQQKDLATASSNYFLESFKKFRNKLFLTKRVFVRVGGSAHDNVAAVDVMMDAILATRHSLKKGFVLGGNRTLAMALKEICAEHMSAAKQYSELWRIYADSIIAAIEAVFRAATKEFKCRRLRNKKISHKSFDLLHPERPEVDLDHILSEGNFTSSINNEALYAVIIQPAPVDIEVVKRFGEFSLKFACSRKIVTPGGVVLDPSKMTK